MFIKVTLHKEKGIMLIRVEDIKHVEDVAGFAKIKFNDGTFIFVMESVDNIAESLYDLGMIK